MMMTSICIMVYDKLTIFNNIILSINFMPDTTKKIMAMTIDDSDYDDYDNDDDNDDDSDNRDQGWPSSESLVVQVL